MTDIQKTGIIGLGLIGGSFALALKRAFPVMQIYGDDAYQLERALQLGLVQEALTDDNLNRMDMIIVATPVDSIAKITGELLNRIKSTCLVWDVGSTKSRIARELATHPKRKNFLLAHPIAGTEYSGPDAAFPDLFKDKINIICDTELTDKLLLDKALNVFNSLQMNTVQMQSEAHDKHIAYVSHLSHISSFMLGKTVMDLEKDEKNIFQMAGSGFASTVRLAKSSPETWTPIFLENKTHIIQSLDEYIDNLNAFKAMLSEGNAPEIKDILGNINHIRQIIDKIEK